MVITVPDEPTDLEQIAIDSYYSARRFSKGKALLQLIEAGVVLKQLGLLEYVIGIAATKDIGVEKGDGDQALKRKIFQVINDQEEGLAGVERSSVKTSPCDAEPEPEPELVNSEAKEPLEVKLAAKAEIVEPKQADISTKKRPFFNRDNGIGSMMSIQTGAKK